MKSSLTIVSVTPLNWRAQSASCSSNVTELGLNDEEDEPGGGAFSYPFFSFHLSPVKASLKK